MRILPEVPPTPEQLTILLEDQPGFLVINGAAGSGKTTTALLRLKHLCAKWLSRKERLGLENPVRVLVLTFNKTLGGYISELASTQVESNLQLETAVRNGDLILKVVTFSKWALDVLPPGGGPSGDCRSVLKAKIEDFGMSTRFLQDEVEYLLGKLRPDELESYMGMRRDGRGTSPRMEAPVRRRLLDEVVYPYLEEKRKEKLRDWHDVIRDAAQTEAPTWDIVIVDEAQDFSANEIRALIPHLSPLHSVTFVMDSVQRIYPRFFTWSEAGIQKVTSRKLKKNYRNTKQIAAFARSIVEGMAFDDDGSLPDFSAASEDGPKPKLLLGSFSEQFHWTLENVVLPASSKGQSVAFLHPLGWFSYIREGLSAASVPYAELTRARSWPQGEESVALSTIHSAKGLEFDHVVILGLSREVTPHGEGDGDSELDTLRRLLAMGIGRARRTVTLGVKQGEESSLVSTLKSDTFEWVVL